VNISGIRGYIDKR